MRYSSSMWLGLAAVTAACTSAQPDVEIRAVSSSQPQGIWEAEAQLALGNVGLALEGFRKILRERSSDPRALVGMAHSYEQMGRLDLSRKWYETALATAPEDPRLLNDFAAFLERQGKFAEAGSVRKEAAANAAAEAQLKSAEAQEARALEFRAAEAAPLAVAPIRPPASVPAAVAVASQPPLSTGATGTPPSLADIVFAEPAPDTSVTVRLPPPKPVQTAAEAPPVPTPQRVLRQVAEASGPRLERLSLGEVALITRPRPSFTGQLVSQSEQSATFRWVPLRPVARLLNAARQQGLAARTRSHLVEKGWRRIEIGDAPAVRSKTLVLYPAFRREAAERLARQFGFTQVRPFNGDEIVVLLGRDAARMKALRPA